jgi:hypothetical protein
LEQDLALHVHLAAPKYDPKRGATTTFYDRVLARKIASIVQFRTAQKRDVRRERQLDDAPDNYVRAPDLTPEQRDLRVDVTDVLARLPGDHRRVARLFMEHSEAEVIRRTGMTRQRVRGLRQRIGQHLRAAGLAEYFSEPGQPAARPTLYIPGSGRRRAVHHAGQHAGRAAKAAVGKSPLGDSPCA